MAIAITRGGMLREHRVNAHGGLPETIIIGLSAAETSVFAADALGREPSRTRFVEFYRVGLTDAFGRAVYVQRW